MQKLENYEEILKQTGPPLAEPKDRSVTGSKPVYFHRGPISGDYVKDLRDPSIAHIHVTVYTPIDIKPIQQKVVEVFGKESMCELQMFSVLRPSLEAGIVDIEVLIPYSGIHSVEEFLKNLIDYVYDVHYYGARHKQVMHGEGGFGTPHALRIPRVR